MNTSFMSRISNGIAEFCDGFLLNPDMWWLIFLPLIVFIFVSSAERRRLQRCQSLGLNVAPRTPRTWIFTFAAWLACIAGLRPYSGYEDIKLQGKGRDILIIADVSLSMLASDVSPDRITIERRKVTDLLKVSRKQGFEDRFGIVTFAGDAQLFCPLTLDLGILQSFAQSLGSDAASNPGSSVAQAIEGAKRALKDSKAQGGAIVVLTDGEDLSADYPSIARDAAANSIQVNVIGIGSLAGSPIPLANGTFAKDTSGNIVTSKLFETGLQQLANGTGGLYSRFSLNDSDVESILAHIHGTGEDASREVKAGRQYHEIGWLMCALVLALFISARALKLWPQIAFLFLLSFAQTSEAQQSAFDGYQAFAQGDLNQARSIFESQSKKDPNNYDLSQALASTRYQLGDFAGATNEFVRAQKLANNPREKFKALYGEGNSRFMSSDFKGALSKYEDAIKIKPGDADTEANIELAKKMLEQMSSSSSSSSENSSESSSQSSSESSSNSSTSSSESSSSSSSGSSDQSSSGSSSQGSSESSSGSPSSGSSSSGGPSSGSSSSETSSEGGEQDSSEQQASSSSVGELERWLDSVEDTPLMPPKNPKKRKATGGQTW